MAIPAATRSDLIASIRAGRQLTDQEFDELLPESFRGCSDSYWTPMEVACRAAALLADRQGARILDVGAGVGKFSIFGALASDAQFFGVEQRPHLAQVAASLAAELGAERARFACADIRAVDWNAFQGFYIYNPFVEHLHLPGNRIDSLAEFGEPLYVNQVRWVQHRLHALRAGTRVVTYHGFGGDMPPSYRLALEEPHGGDYLRLWVRDGD